MLALIFFAIILSAWGEPAEVHKKSPMWNEGLFEGDILGIDPTDRNAIPHDYQRWSSGVIPFVIDNSVSHITNGIISAMKHIQERTCIRFVPRTALHFTYVRIFQGQGCYARIGVQYVGAHELSLGVGCEPFGTIVHELMHIVGFFHEHNRPDRDDYIEINFDKMLPQIQKEFIKLQPSQTRLLTAPFDYDSITIYGKAIEGSVDGKTVLVRAKNGRPMTEAYEKTSMSPADIQRVNILYQCRGI